MDQLGPADVVCGLDEKIYSPVLLPVLAILFKISFVEWQIGFHGSSCSYICFRNGQYIIPRLPASKLSSPTFLPKTYKRLRNSCDYPHAWSIQDLTIHKNGSSLEHWYQSPTLEPDQLQENLQEVILSVEVSTTSAHVRGYSPWSLICMTWLRLGHVGL